MKQRKKPFGNSGFMHSTSPSFASSIHTLYYRRLETMVFIGRIDSETLWEGDDFIKLIRRLSSKIRHG